MASKEQAKNAEFEQNVTCPVCLARFNDSDRKPKYLVSCCHTVCRSCLDQISQSGALKRILCPICRSLTDFSRGIDGLPTNGDKLYLLKLEKPCQEKSDDEALDWCFTCRKKTSTCCSTENHSVIVMNPQLLNSEIQLNMVSLSAGLKAYGEAIIRHRREIGARLEHVSKWLNSYQRMISEFQTANQNRITQLTGMIQGKSLTLSIQKLMRLSMNAEENLGLLKDGEQEEALVSKLLQELKTIEQVADIRKNPFVLTPFVPHLRKELEYDKYFPDENQLQWPALLLDALGPSSTSTSPSFVFGVSSGNGASPTVPQRQQSPVFRLPDVHQYPNSAPSTGRAVTHFGPGTSSTTTPSPDSRREIISVRRRR